MVSTWTELITFSMLMNWGYCQVYIYGSKTFPNSS